MVTGEMRNVGAHCVSAVGSTVRRRSPLIREAQGVRRYVCVLRVPHRARAVIGPGTVECERHVGVRGLRMSAARSNSALRVEQATYIVGEDLFQGGLEMDPWEDLQSLVNVPRLGVRVVHDVSVELLPLPLVLLERSRLEALEIAADSVLLLGRVARRHQALQQINDID